MRDLSCKGDQEVKQIIMKILVVFTGGTIGSSIVNDTADVDPGAAKGLLGMYPDVEFVCVELFSMLSENSTVDTLEKLCNFMLRIDYSDYDGVIVTHGSDTLGYTAALLGVAMSCVKIPVMITAADYVLSDRRSNGIDNFCGCVDFIGEFSKGKHSYAGVYAVWKNRGDYVRVHRAARLEQADFNDEFRSFGGECFGTIRSGRFVKNKTASDFAESGQPGMSLLGKRITLSRKILLLKSYAGADFDCVSIQDKDAVIVQTYHSGTVCTVGDNTSFVKFAKRCSEHNVDVYVFPIRDRGYIYRSSKEIPWDIVKPLFNVGECEAYARLLLKYGEIRRS